MANIDPTSRGAPNGSAQLPKSLSELIQAQPDAATRAAAHNWAEKLERAINETLRDASPEAYSSFPSELSTAMKNGNFTSFPRPVNLEVLGSDAVNQIAQAVLVKMKVTIAEVDTAIAAREKLREPEPDWSRAFEQTSDGSWHQREPESPPGSPLKLPK